MPQLLERVKMVPLRSFATADQPEVEPLADFQMNGEHCNLMGSAKSMNRLTRISEMRPRDKQTDILVLNFDSILIDGQTAPVSSALVTV